MKHVFPLVSLAVMLFGGWFFFSNFQVDLTQPSPQVVARDPQGNYSAPPLAQNSSPFGQSTTPPPLAAPPLAQGSPAPQSSWPVATTSTGGAAPVARDTIRIGSFNIQVFGESKIGKPDVMNVLSSIVRNFDVVAIQEIRSARQDILPNFIQQINSRGRRYDFVIGERIGRTSSKEQYAFIFDTDTIEVDRRTLYTVYDPDDLLHREPLVGWFRCKAPDPREAFTFSLVNIHVDPDETNLSHANNELDVLDDVMVQVRGDGRGEDDVILLGDFNANDRNLGHLSRMPNVGCVISNTPTNTRGNAQFDNIVMDTQATREFMGKGGVFDFMRQYNLTLEQALTVSDHLPVWAEFSVFEGGVAGRVARNAARQSYDQYRRN